jgi:YD repeat-containing protein
LIRFSLKGKSSAYGAVRYAYDALGRLVATSTSEAEHRFIYNPAGRLIDERAAYRPGLLTLPGQAGPIAAFTMTHAYDERATASRRSSRRPPHRHPALRQRSLARHARCGRTK